MDTIALERLAHAVHRAAALGDHRYIRSVYGEALGAAGCDEVLARGGYQHALIAERNHVGAELHGVAVGNGDGTDAFRFQPVHELGLDGLDAYHGEALREHAHLHIEVQEVRVELIRVQLPSFSLEPALELTHRRFDGALPGVAACGNPRLQHHEIA